MRKDKQCKKFPLEDFHKKYFNKTVLKQITLESLSKPGLAEANIS